MAVETCAMMRARDQATYVVYPAALFDGWEVVREPDNEALYFGTREDAFRFASERAAVEGGAVVKLENWFGDTLGVWEILPPASRRTTTV